MYWEFFSTEAQANVFLKWLRKDFQRRLGLALKDNSSAVYFRHLDILGHLMVSEERYNRWYRRFERLVKALARTQEVLVVSDHGTTLQGLHTLRGFACATFSLDGIETIMDFATVLPLRFDEEERPQVSQG